MEPTGNITSVGIVPCVGRTLVLCKRCRAVLSKGYFGIGIQIGIHSYLVSEHPPKVCCGFESRPPLLFPDAASAKEASREVAEALVRVGGVENLHVLEIPGFGSPAVH